MALKIYWTLFAKSELKRIFFYYKDVATSKIASKVIEGIVNKTDVLLTHPFVGQIEELLLDRNIDFRYLVYGNYKIIYFVSIENSRIEIVDVFDTRQNPIKIKK